jgi:hypothetical protein
LDDQRIIIALGLCECWEGKFVRKNRVEQLNNFGKDWGLAMQVLNLAVRIQVRFREVDGDVGQVRISVSEQHTYFGKREDAIMARRLEHECVCRVGVDPEVWEAIDRHG